MILQYFNIFSMFSQSSLCYRNCPFWYGPSWISAIFPCKYFKKRKSKKEKLKKKKFFQPFELDEALHPGFVERQRRSAVGSEEIPDDEPLYTLYSLGGAPCILAKLDAHFFLEYRTRTHGTQVAKVCNKKLKKLIIFW